MRRAEGSLKSAAEKACLRPNASGLKPPRTRSGEKCWTCAAVEGRALGMDTGGSEEPYTPFNARSACHVLDAAFALVLHGLAELLLAGRVYSSEVYLVTASTWISVVVIGYWVVAYAWVGVVVRCHEPIALCAEVCDGDRALTIFVALCMLGPGPCP